MRIPRRAQEDITVVRLNVSAGLIYSVCFGNILFITARKPLMTTTVKLPATLELALRQRCAAEGRSLSDVMRDALTAYLDRPTVPASAWQLGLGLFGRYSGPADLAATRKSHAADIWLEKHAQRPAP